MTWKINVPARVGRRDGWILTRDGEPVCPFSTRHIIPTRAAARREARRLGGGLRGWRAVRCRVVVAWSKA